MGKGTGKLTGISMLCFIHCILTARIHSGSVTNLKFVSAMKSLEVSPVFAACFISPKKVILFSTVLSWANARRPTLPPMRISAWSYPLTPGSQPSCYYFCICKLQGSFDIWVFANQPPAQRACSGLDGAEPAVSSARTAFAPLLPALA